jgi:alpha-tubulin suppressor-like RCC1 family protein
MIPSLAGVAELAVGAGYHSCARLADGAVRCWGNNGSGQLGDGTVVDRRAPVAVAGLDGVAQLAAGGEHTCARMLDGTVRCWGLNASGQLGDGTTGGRLAPTPVR